MKAVRAAGFGKSRNGSWGADRSWRPARPRGASPFGKVLVSAGEWRLTVREAAFSVFIAGAMAFAGFFVAGAIDKSVKDGDMGEDDGDRQLKELDKITKQFTDELDSLLETKQKEIMEV